MPVDSLAARDTPDASVAWGAVGTSVAFALFSVLVIVAAWRVVTSKNIVRAALALVIVLGGTAPLFLLVGAEFVAIVQVLVYVGAVIVLFLFGIMLTRQPLGPAEHNHLRRWLAAMVAATLLGTLCYAINDSVGRSKVEPDSPMRTAEVGTALLRNQVIAFEAISVLLLAALIGAITLARRN